MSTTPLSLKPPSMAPSITMTATAMGGMAIRCPSPARGLVRSYTRAFSHSIRSPLLAKLARAEHKNAQTFPFSTFLSLSAQWASRLSRFRMRSHSPDKAYWHTYFVNSAHNACLLIPPFTFSTQIYSLIAIPDTQAFSISNTNTKRHQHQSNTSYQHDTHNTKYEIKS